MKSIFIFLSLNFFVVIAYPQHELQIYVPGIQYRYEEGSDQNLDLRNYTHYSLNYMYQNILMGLEHNTNKENTGSASLGVKASAKEWNAVLGYSLAKLELQNVAPNTNFEILGFVLTGQTKTEIETTLNGQSQTNASEKQSVLGIGGILFFRLNYFIAGFDMRMMQSNAYEPKAVSVSTIKLGANFHF